ENRTYACGMSRYVESGDTPELEDYLQRFPQFANQAVADEPEDATDVSFGGWPERPALNQPPSLPGYEILGELGRGGMGLVYRARQVNLKRLVAIKLIRAGALATTEEEARFRREAEAVARLQHPHVVQIHEIGEHNGLPYLVLELVNGPTLDAIVN